MVEQIAIVSKEYLSFGKKKSHAYYVTSFNLASSDVCIGGYFVMEYFSISFESVRMLSIS